MLLSASTPSLLSSLGSLPTSHTDPSWFRTSTGNADSLDRLEREEAAYELYLKSKREATAPPPIGTATQTEDQGQQFLNPRTTEDIELIEEDNPLTEEEEEEEEADQGFRHESAHLSSDGTPVDYRRTSAYRQAQEAAASALRGGDFETPPYYGMSESLMGGVYSTAAGAIHGHRSSPYPVRQLHATPNGFIQEDLRVMPSAGSSAWENDMESDPNLAHAYTSQEPASSSRYYTDAAAAASRFSAPSPYTHNSNLATSWNNSPVDNTQLETDDSGMILANESYYSRP